MTDNNLHIRFRTSSEGSVMNKGVHIKICIVLGLLTTMLTNGQTINNGILTVRPGTELSIASDFENSPTGSIENDGDTYYYGDVVNNGTIDYDVALDSGITRFTGDQTQQITANNPSFFYNLVLNNTSSQGIVQEGTLQVEGEMDFTSGILDTDTHPSAELILTAGSSVVNANNDSFVHGYITKEGNDAITFPTGDETARAYRHAAITAPNNNTTVMNSRFVYDDPANPYPTVLTSGNLVLISEEEYWIIENQSAPETVSVTISWDENSTTPQNIVAAPTEAIRMARWNFNTNSWEELANTVLDPNNKTITAPTQLIEDTAVFTIARADIDATLPGGVTIWNAVSANGDGENDFFRIDNIHTLPNNRVEVYNRSGTKVFETEDYGVAGNVFDGKINPNTTKQLPTGTYFYILSYEYQDAGRSKRFEKVGYLYLSID